MNIIYIYSPDVTSMLFVCEQIDKLLNYYYESNNTKKFDKTSYINQKKKFQCIKNKS